MTTPDLLDLDRRGRIAAATIRTDTYLNRAKPNGANPTDVNAATWVK